MTKGRLEAFSDGVIAIIITIMVLELRAPHQSNPAALIPLIPVFLSYLLSFIFLGIYWNNHHHLLHAVEHVNGRVLWANLHLLFWLSLVTLAIYGMVLLLAAIAYFILVRTLLSVHGRNSVLATALGSDFKGKISMVIYVVAIPLALVKWWIACSLYILVAIMWLVPDRRIERTLTH